MVCQLRLKTDLRAPLEMTDHLDGLSCKCSANRGMSNPSKVEADRLKLNKFESL